MVRFKINGEIRDVAAEEADLLVMSCMLNKVPFEVIRFG